jgi:hypothetical protein
LSLDLTKCREGKGGNIITPKCRLSFVHLISPNENSKTKKGAPKYQVSLLIPPKTDLTLMKKSAAAAAKEKWGGDMPKKLKTPFLDAGEYDYEGYEKGWTLIRASTTRKPQIVNARNQPVGDDHAEIYSGRWACVSLNAYGYDTDGNKGVSFGLQNVQLLDHDTPFAGGASAEDEFEAMEGESAFEEGEGKKGDLDDDIPF